MAIQFSEQTDKLFAGLMLVQQKCGIIGKDAENPHFKSEYVSLEKLWTVVKPLLKEAGLIVIQTPGLMDGTKLTMETCVIHQESGQFMISAGQMPTGKDGPQAVGSAITYARRYFLASCLSVVAGDEDDDGEAAEGRKGPAIPAAKLGDLKARKEAVFAWAKTAIQNKPQDWASEVLGRKVDASLKLQSEEEVVKLEVEVERIKKLGLT